MVRGPVPGGDMKIFLQVADIRFCKNLYIQESKLWTALGIFTNALHLGHVIAKLETFPLKRRRLQEGHR